MRDYFSVAVALAVCVASSAHADAGFKTGAMLWNDCGEITSGSPPAACMEYVQGVSDSLAVLAPHRYCPPANVTVGRVTDAVRSYLYDHPDERRYSAASTTALALMVAFPCKPGAIVAGVSTPRAGER